MAYSIKLVDIKNDIRNLLLSPLNHLCSLYLR